LYTKKILGNLVSNFKAIFTGNRFKTAEFLLPI